MIKKVFIRLCLAVGVMSGIFLYAADEPERPVSPPPKPQEKSRAEQAISRLERITPSSTGVMPLEIKQSLSETIEKVQMGRPQIRGFLKTIAVSYKLNIVATEALGTRQITLFLGELQNITLGELLEIILLTNDLAMEIKGNIINIITAAEFSKLYGRSYSDNRQFKMIKLKYLKPSQAKKILVPSCGFSSAGEATEVINEDDPSQSLIITAYPHRIKLVEETLQQIDRPLQTRVFEPKYAKISTIEALLTKEPNPIVTKDIGYVKTDLASGKIFVTDTVDNLNKISNLIKDIDGKPRQVLIEARMIQIQLNDVNYLGVNWEKVFSSQSVWKGVKLVGKYPFPPVIQPKPGDTFSATVGTIPPDNFTAALKALEAYGSLKTISSPRIISQNNSLAKIMVGSREAYVTTTQTTTQGVQTITETVQFLAV